VLKRRDIEYLSTSGVCARSFAFTPGHLGNTATTKEAAMETREQHQPACVAAQPLRNPLLALASQRCYAPPVEGQTPSQQWLADPENHGLWLTRLAAQVHLDVPTLRAGLYDVASLSVWQRAQVSKAVINYFCSSEGDRGRVDRLYDEYCAAVIWARLQVDRRVLVVDGVTLYDARAIAATVGWSAWQGWYARMARGSIAATRWYRRLYTTEEAMRCWFSGRPQPSIPDLAAAVRAAGCARRLPSVVPVPLTASWGSPWVEFQGERYIWGQDVTRLYGITARTLRRARREGKLEAGIVLCQVLIPFKSLQQFLRWWYSRGCTWKGQTKAEVVDSGR